MRKVTDILKFLNVEPGWSVPLGWKVSLVESKPPLPKAWLAQLWRGEKIYFSTSTKSAKDALARALRWWAKDQRTA